MVINLFRRHDGFIAVIKAGRHRATRACLSGVRGDSTSPALMLCCLLELNYSRL
jgi:hypothetical protein